MNDCSALSIQMGQESFALFPHTGSKVFGIIQMHSTGFIPPAWTRIHLLGKEQIGTVRETILDDAYILSNDWTPSSEKNTYNLPFTLSIPSNIPNSFQITSDNMLGGVYYTLEAKVASMQQTAIEPVHFHYSDHLQKIVKPKRVFWGITKGSKQKWQYEIEFLNTFDILSSKSGSLSVKLRPMFRQAEVSCCLVGCQIIQQVHMKGCKDRHHVLATATRLLMSPSKTWSEPCQICFNLEGEIIPTASSERVGVEHWIKVTIAFCNTSCDSALDIHLEFPIRFTGYISNYKVPGLTRSNSICSSCFTIEEAVSQDSTICMSSCKSNNSIYFSL